MHSLDSPFVVFAAVLITQWLAAYAGDAYRKKVRPLKGIERVDFDIIRTAALTLLGLIIGFSFAMAVSRYDQRKNLEQAEANAIGTEYLRADLLPPDAGSRVRELLRAYCNERVSFYLARSEQRVAEIDLDTGKLQKELWATVARVASAANARHRPCRCGNERGAEFTGGHAGSVVESYPVYRLGIDGFDRCGLQPADGLWRASHDCVPDSFTADHIDVALSHCGH